MFSKRKSKYILWLLLLAAIGGFIAYKITYKPHKTIQEMTTDFKGTTSELILKVMPSPDLWNNKTVEITGEITNIDAKGFMLNSSVYCQKNTLLSHQIIPKVGDSHTIKGRIIGYDDLLEELKLDKVIFIK